MLTQVQSGMLQTTAQYYSMKNRIINGAMVIDQRDAGASVTITNTSAGTYVLDRWQGYGTVASKFSIQQTPSTTETGYATRVGAGFINYLGVTSSASAYSVGSTDRFQVAQAIEGLNIADLAWGTANAKTVTLSFWVYSSLTGSFGGSLGNQAGNYQYPFSYSIPVANTWTQISLTITGATSGTWLTTNGVGVYVLFGLGVGSSLSGTAGAWTTSTVYVPTGSVSVVGTANATFYITGVQLEVGTQATSFDYRPYGTELQLCQRYYETSFNYGVAPADNVNSPSAMPGYPVGVCLSGSDMRATPIYFKVEKRVVPTTVNFYRTTSGSTNGQWDYYSGSWNTAVTSTDVLSTKGMDAIMTVSGRSLGQAYIVGGFWSVSSEL